jgi:hypothetical protein
VPSFRISFIKWANNTVYATRRATHTEIEEVLTDHRSLFRRNLPGRTATHVVDGRTRAGRRLVIAFLYQPEGRTAIPLTAWERR